MTTELTHIQTRALISHLKQTNANNSFRKLRMVHGLVIRLCLLTAALAAMWWGTAPPLRAVRSGAATFDDLLTLGIAAVGWVAMSWLALVAAAVAMSECSGLVGRWGGWVAQNLAPAAVRRVVIAATGLSVSVLANAPMSTAMPILTSPGATSPATCADGGGGSALPAIGRPAAAETPSPDNPSSAARTRIIVQPGDSLWKIADHALGGDAAPRLVAESWPRWFAANRDEIGPDPNRIHAGMRLVAPPPLSTE